MRMQLRFTLKNPEIKLDYHPCLVSFMKKALMNYDKNFFDLYYGNGTQIKSFSFSVRLPRPKFQKENVLLSSNRIEINWSALDERDALIFYNAFLTQKAHEFALPDDNTMSLQKIIIQPEKKISKTQIIVKMCSPFVIRIHDKATHKNRYVSCSDTDFIEAAKNSIMLQTHLLRIDTSLMQGFSVEGVKTWDCIVKTFNHTVSGILGVLKLEGKPEFLEMLYKSGIGSNRSIGFGLFEVIY